MKALEEYNTGSAYVAAELYYWNPESGEWELAEVDYKIADGKAEFNIDHFSRYGIGGRTR